MQRAWAPPDLYYEVLPSRSIVDKVLTFSSATGEDILALELETSFSATEWSGGTRHTPAPASMYVVLFADLSDQRLRLRDRGRGTQRVRDLPRNSDSPSMMLHRFHWWFHWWTCQAAILCCLILGASTSEAHALAVCSSNTAQWVNLQLASAAGADAAMSTYYLPLGMSPKRFSCSSDIF